MTTTPLSSGMQPRFGAVYRFTDRDIASSEIEPLGYGARMASFYDNPMREGDVYRHLLLTDEHVDQLAKLHQQRVKAFANHYKAESRLNSAEAKLKSLQLKNKGNSWRARRLEEQIETLEQKEQKIDKAGTRAFEALEGYKLLVQVTGNAALSQLDKAQKLYELDVELRHRAYKPEDKQKAQKAYDDFVATLQKDEPPSVPDAVKERYIQLCQKQAKSNAFWDPIKSAVAKPIEMFLFGIALLKKPPRW